MKTHVKINGFFSNAVDLGTL